jgi:hypothetical protein
VIARPLPYDDEMPRRAGTRAGRAAVGERQARLRRRRYAALRRIAATAALATACIVAYLYLMANVTRMNYELTHVAADRARLVDESARLDDRIAALESPERLAKLAAQLHMHEPPTFAAIDAPQNLSPVPAHGIAFLDWLK